MKTCKTLLRARDLSHDHVINNNNDNNNNNYNNNNNNNNNNDNMSASRKKEGKSWISIRIKEGKLLGNGE